MTSGADGWYRVVVPAMRAESVVTSRNGDHARLDLVYRGPTASTVPLANGVARRQIGVKLRARDTCNVVYVTWHVAPTSGIHVSVKSNPGSRTHRECGDRGYITVRPVRSEEVNALTPDTGRTLEARIDDDWLVVTVDRRTVWEGRLPPAARDLRGPTGVRSDNGEFDFALTSP